MRKPVHWYYYQQINFDMKHFNAFFIVVLFLFGFSAFSQVETRLATNCATKQIEIPVLVKNLENIKAFEFQILFDNSLLQFDTSLYHNLDVERTDNENYDIKVRSSNDTIYVNWAAYYGVNIEEDLLLSLIFTENGSGTAEFSWITDNCSYTNINDLDIPSDYKVDSDVDIPYDAKVEISFDQFTIGCRDDSENGGCKAQAEVNITGGLPPYTYLWSSTPPQNDNIAYGLCQDPISVIITDAAECIYGDLFAPVIYPAINPDDVAGFEIEYTPDEIFITKPYVEFTVDPGSTIIEKYEWDFGDETKAFTQTAEHAYRAVNTYAVSLKTENIDGCDTTISVNVEIKELNFCIPNVFTPNGDGINDNWIFKLVGADGGGSSEEDLKATGLKESKNCTGEDLIFPDHFKTTQLVVYNRAGAKVFDCANCMDNWDGGGLPDGVYFYVFTWEGEYSNGKEHGNVTILGSSN